MSAGQYILMAVHILIMALFLILFLKSRGEDVSKGADTAMRADTGADRAGRRKKSGVFAGMGNYLCDLIFRREEKKGPDKTGPGMLICSHRVREEMSLLHPLENAGRKSREFAAGKISLFLTVLFMGNLAAMAVNAAGFLDTELVEGKKVLRNDPGQGTRQINLNAYLDGDRERIRVELEESLYTQEELQNFLEEAAVKLDGTIQGDNPSLDQVRQPLLLPNRIDGLPFQISWEFDNYQVLDADGVLREEFLPEEGILVKLTAALVFRDFKGEYIRYARLFPQRPEDKTLRDKLLDAVRKADAAARGGREVVLPHRLGDREIRWKESFHSGAAWLLLLAAGAGVLMFMGRDGELKRQVEERNRRLSADYPDLVYKLSLLMGAGMTVRTAWKRIVERDGRRGGLRGEENHFLRDEMRLTLHEMENGIPEQETYIRFGRRCGLPVYIKFSTLLAQSQKKGSQGMVAALEEEVRDAFRERKNTARKEGEEAGTKLLFPMAMMLGVVMVIIVVPAFMSFQF